MLAAHMDEVGLMLMQAGNEGLWKFGAVGGVNEPTLAGQGAVDRKGPRSRA